MKEIRYEFEWTFPKAWCACTLSCSRAARLHLLLAGAFQRPIQSRGILQAKMLTQSVQSKGARKANKSLAAFLGIGTTIT